MKAFVQFELSKPNLSEKELKEELIEHMVDVCIDWVNGDGIMIIEFIETYEKNFDNYGNNNKINN
tara:strand:+ start:1767 stop:1961 length:195 start_codon:yes stop_codon:yes gene_type:complete